MRATIIGWSAFSGVVLGLFVDATLIGVASLLSAGRPYPRWLVASGVVVMIGILLVMTTLGYLEGRIKSV